MQKQLVKETAFGNATARVTVTYFTTFNTDFQMENSKIEKLTKIAIVKPNGQIALEADDDFLRVVEDNDMTHTLMIKAGMDLNKKYTRVDKAFTLGTETYDRIKSIIEELNNQLAKECGIKTEAEESKEAEIKQAEAIVSAAEKEGIDKLLTAAELKVWRKRYNDINNEGGEGYIPTRISKEDYAKALNILNK
ncbi:MAG: hypothetical protein ABF820_11800 [Sporolactobacillus sp.]